MAAPVYNPADNHGPMLLATSLPFYALALICFAFRIASRLRPKFALTAADYTCAIAVAFKTAAIAFMSVSIAHGFGRHNVYIADRAAVLRNNLGVFMTGTGASCWARVSIACLLLQFTTSRRWRALIWFTLALNIVDFVVYEVVQLANCTSVLMQGRAEVLKGTSCLTPMHVWSFTYAAVAVAMVSDLVCALIPVFIIWRLSRSVLERSLVSILMASCLLASGCGVAKLYYMIVYDFSTPDNYYDLIPEFFWCRMEEAIIIIACCVPLLKSPFERMLRRVGLPTLKIPPPGLNRVLFSPPSAGGESDKELTRAHSGTGSEDSAGSGRNSSDEEGGERREVDLERGVVMMKSANSG